MWWILCHRAARCISTIMFWNMVTHCIWQTFRKMFVATKLPCFLVSWVLNADRAARDDDASANPDKLLQFAQKMRCFASNFFLFETLLKLDVIDEIIYSFVADWFSRLLDVKFGFAVHHGGNINRFQPILIPLRMPRTIALLDDCRRWYIGGFSHWPIHTCPVATLGEVFWLHPFMLSKQTFCKLGVAQWQSVGLAPKKNYNVQLLLYIAIGKSNVLLQGNTLSKKRPPYNIGLGHA